MWICNECGQEIKLLVEIKATYSLGKNYNEEQEKEVDESGTEYYMCNCMKESKDNVELEDIANWED